MFWLVVVDQAIAAWLAKLDVLVHRHGFNDFKRQSIGFDLGFQRLDFVLRPDFADRHIINCRHDAMHAGDLADVFQFYGIVVAIPAEGHFHGKAPCVDWWSSGQASLWLRRTFFNCCTRLSQKKDALTDQWK
jgi:hypothetical protein